MGIQFFILSSVFLLKIVNAYWNCPGGNCAISGPATCPQGFQLSGNVCMQSSTTICQPGVTGSCEVCPNGYYLRGGSCERYVCPQNYVFMNGQCQAPIQNCHYTCEPGYVMQLGVCHLQTPQPCAQHCTTSVGCQQSCQNQVCCQQPPTVVCPTPPPIYPPPVYPPPVYPPPILPPPIIYPPVFPTLPPATTQPPSPPSIQPTTTRPPPIQCPEGYILIHGECRKISCPPGSIYHEGTCININCPRNTSWDGQKCHVINNIQTNTSVDINQYINNKNEINNPTNVNINNENKVLIYTADEKVVTVASSSPRTEIVTSLPPVTTPQPVPTLRPEKCCTVVTPRICSNISKRWVCYNRRYQRCGSFCTSSKIYLRPIRPIQRQSIVVVPPRLPIEPCLGYECGLSHADCSGCMTGGVCTPYCFDYSCQGQCEFYDQRSYCQEYSGQPGCFENDGCYEDWCS